MDWSGHLLEKKNIVMDLAWNKGEVILISSKITIEVILMQQLLSLLKEMAIKSPITVRKEVQQRHRSRGNSMVNSWYSEDGRK